jgi:hypothetical protein
MHRMIFGGGGEPGTKRHAVPFMARTQQQGVQTSTVDERVGLQPVPTGVPCNKDTGPELLRSEDQRRPTATRSSVIRVTARRS